MQSYQPKAPSENSVKSSPLFPVAIGGGAFIVGAVLTFGYVQLNAQKQQLALMSQMVEQLGQKPVAVQAPQAVQSYADTSVQAQAGAELVTRDAPADLLALPAAAGLATPAIAAPLTPKAEPAPVPQSTAEKLQALVATAAAEPQFGTPTLGAQAISDARRLETLAIVHAGVQELVAAVVAGQYDIHTDYEDEHFSGRIHFAFVGHEQDQTELERFLSQAAEDGIIAHSNSVVDADGSVNGHILLFDLVERALENGTPQERMAGEKMRREALAMLANDLTVGTAPDVAGERFYTVESGDSLAFISLQFYGNTNGYAKIFEANRGQLSTPDRIRVGQRLVIPKA